MSGTQTQISITRNPNLSIPRLSEDGRVGETLTNQVMQKFGDSWWTGTHPEKTPGFIQNTETGFHYVQALPLLNLEICTRQDVLDYFNNTWTLTEILFSGIKTEEAYTRPPYHQLRHPMIFYYGHTAVVYMNKMRLAGLISEPLDLYLEKVLETGVDEMSWDDMSKNEMLWPSVEVVKNYRQKVYNLIKNIILTHPDLEQGVPFARKGPDSSLWSIFMGFEHEKIHFETSSVLIRELPLFLVETPQYWAPSHPSAISVIVQSKKSHLIKPQSSDLNWVKVKGGSVSYGKPQDAPSFGWDNEYGQRALTIKDFQVTQNLISNSDYYEFVRSMAYVDDRYWSAEGLQWRKYRNSKRPCFWVGFGPEGLHDYKLRTIFDVVEMPWDWPVEVNFHEAQAFARWKQEQDLSTQQSDHKLTYRLITEAEHVLLRDIDARDPVLQNKPYAQQTVYHWNQNFNFQISTPRPVGEDSPNSKGVRDLFGNVWQWALDQFNPLENFKVNRLYDDFSTPCFDGKHQMILGGSFISCGHEASHWARFHFRPHFFQHSGFRLAATLDGSADNSAKLLKQTHQYTHQTRKNILEQTKNQNWWQNVEQPLDSSSEELKQIWESAVEQIIGFEERRSALSPMGTALDPKSNKVSKEFLVPYQASKNFPSGESSDFKSLLRLITEELAPLGQLPGHPGYMAYVAGAGNVYSQVAQALAQTVNPFTGHYSLSPGLVRLEQEALGWIKESLGYSLTDSTAFFTTGGSLATLSALSFARQNKLKGTDLAKARFYTSNQAHHSVGKALSILGFPSACLKLISTNEAMQIKISELASEIQKDKQAGLQPLCIIGTLGTTNTGSVDPIKDLVAIQRTHSLWLHIDAAYGGFFALTQKGRKYFELLSEADSVTLDPHKSFSMPYGLGCLIVKNKNTINYNFSGEQSYMPPAPSTVDTEIDFADLSPELSRDFRGLRFWLPLKALGVEPFILNLEEKLKLTEYIYNELKTLSGIHVLTEPELSITTFRLDSDEKTSNLLESINRSGVFYLSGCRIENRQYIRISLLGFRSHYSDCVKLVDLIRSEIKNS